MLVQYDCSDKIESLKKGRIRAQIKSECAVNLKEMEYVEESTLIGVVPPNDIKPRRINTPLH